MKSKSLKIICVGKLKTACWKMAAEHYMKLIGKWRSLEYIEVRDGSSELKPEARKAQEAERIIAKIAPGDMPAALAVEGKSLSSPQLASLIHATDEAAQKNICFIIGGPYGFDQKIMDLCAMSISLSAMTWPHELARVMLLEQLFRAESIINHFPYHH